MGTPKQYPPNLVVFTREESLRVERYIARVGLGNAAKLLHVGEVTLDAARDQGRLQRKTHDRLFEALEREELKAS